MSVDYRHRTHVASHLTLRVSVLVAATAWVVGCGEPQPPVAVGSMPDLTVEVGSTESVDLARYFSDPDGDKLSHEATSSDEGVATASVSGASLTVAGVSAATATVTVTATDPGGLSVKQSFTVSVPNRAPEASEPIPDAEVHVGETVQLTLHDHFSDPDGDVITYEATSSNELLLTVSVSQDELTLAGVRPGTVTVSVTATDPEGLSATQDFNTIVEVNHAPEVVDTIAGASMDQDESVVFELSSYFSDPDDDPLTYTAVPSDTLAVSVSIKGNTLRISSGAPDGTTVEVTATDPSGLSATQTPYFAVDEGFSEDFTDLDSLHFWRVSGSIVEAELSDEGLEVTLTYPSCGHAFKRVRSKLSEWWTFSAEIGTEDKRAVTYLMVETDHPSIDAYRLLVGSGMRFDGAHANYRLDAREGNLWIARAGGLSDELDDLGYELNEVALEYSGDSDTLVARVDTLELVTLDLGNAGLPTVATGETGFGICSLANDDEDHRPTAIVESGFLEGGYESGAPARPRAAEPSPAGFVLPGLPPPPHHLPALQPRVPDRMVHWGPAIPVNGFGIRSQFQQCRKRHRIAQRRDMQRRPAGPCRRIHVRSGSHQQFQHGRVRVG